MPRNIGRGGPNPRSIAEENACCCRRNCGRRRGDNELQSLGWQSSDKATRCVLGGGQFRAARAHLHLIAIEASVRERTFNTI